MRTHIILLGHHKLLGAFEDEKANWRLVDLQRMGVKRVLVECLVIEEECSRCKPGRELTCKRCVLKEERNVMVEPGWTNETWKAHQTKESSSWRIGASLCGHLETNCWR